VRSVLEVDHWCNRGSCLILFNCTPFSHLILFSILGTLARLGVQWLTRYPNAPVLTDEIWANVGGSFILGFLREDKAVFAQRRGSALLRQSWWKPKIKEESRQVDSETVVSAKGKQTLQATQNGPNKTTLPLYIGLSVGFCGSFTSFSSFIRDAFLTISNDVGSQNTSAAPRNAAWSLCAVLAVLFAEVTLSLSALCFGAHFAIATMPILARIPKMNSERLVNPIAAFLGWGCWLGAVFLAIWSPHDYWRGEVIFALVFAPIGCLLRFLLAIKMNGISSKFPLGTFTANLFGTVLLGMCYDLQRTGLGTANGRVGGGIIGCQVLQGVQDGFSGCLTTVSTWVAELKSLRKHHAYTYGAVSIGVCLASLVVIIGSLHWTLGLSPVACRI
jgi:CrcB protein